MPVPITFTADLTAVRKAIDDLSNEMRNKGVGLPVGGAGAGGIAAGFQSVAGGGGAGIPSIGGVFGASFNNVAGGYGAGVGPLGVGTGLGAGLASPQGFFGASGGITGTQPTTFSVFGQANAAGGVIASGVGGGGGGTGDGGGAGGSFGSGFFSRGFGRLAGAGYAVHVGFAEAAASREYNVDTTLAGNDQAAQLAATMKYRDRVISGGGWIGQAVGFLQDPSGMGEAGITAVMDAAKANQGRADAIEKATAFGRGLTDAADLAGVENPIERARIQERIRHRDSEETIEKVKGNLSAADLEVVHARERELATTRRGRASEMVDIEETGGYEDSLSGAMEKVKVDDAKVVSDLRDRLLKADAGRLQGPMRADEARQHQEILDEINRTEIRQSARDEFLFGQSATESLAGITAGYYTATNQPRAAERARLAGNVEQANAAAQFAVDNPQNFSALPAAIMGRLLVGLKGEAALGAFDAETDRRQADNRTDLEAKLGIGQAIWFRDPDAAQELAIRRGAEKERREDRRDFGGANLDVINENETQDIANLGRQTRERRQLRLDALGVEGEVLDAQLAVRRYGDVAASAVGISGSAIVKANAILQNNANDAPLAQKEIENALKEEQLNARQFLQRFRATEGDLNRIDPSGGGQGNDVLQVLRDIAQGIQRLNDKQNTLGRVGP